jgi:phosphoglycolate phosphatase
MPKLSINGNLYSPKLILFDVDGTLVDDTHRYSSLGKARYKAFKEMASEKAAKEWARLSGVKPDDWTIDPSGPISKAPRRDDLALAAGALYLDGYNWYEARALAEKIYEKADEDQKKNFKPQLYEGVEEKLRELSEAGYMLGVATNGVTEITEELLTELDINELFSIVVGADLVDKSKPAPDMILYACENSGQEASECMYVGDQPTDMEAALDALVLIGVGVRNHDLVKRGAREVLRSVKDIQIV